VVLAEQPGGYVLRRIAYEIAFENWRRDRADAVAGPGGGADPARGILEGTAIAAGVRPAEPGPRALRVRLTGTSLDGFDLNGGRQQLRGDTLLVTREPDDLLEADWALGRRSAAFGLRFTPELRAEPLLQVNDRAITDLAVRIAGNDRDPRVVAERLARWVHDSLGKVATVTVPSAVQVLRARRGDAAEHTQLFTALARSVGIPTRIATGLLLVDGTFHYHAWPEVRLRDWVAVDPTFGQFPADAARLRFVRGSLTRQGELLRLVGNLRIEVLPTR
jgi:transglutaminase-like putative cysteine protease